MFRTTRTVLKGGTGLLRQCTQSFTPVILITAGKHHAVASTEAKPQIINKNLTFRWAYDSPFDQDSRPLILLYSWLVAKARHMHKYGDFYLKKGWDVLHVKVNPMQLLMPSNAQQVVGQVLEFTQKPEHLRQPILIHGFSVGGYLWGETLVKILSNKALAENLGQRLRGQVMDSPVSYDGIPFGVSRALTNIPVLQTVIEKSIASYLSIMKDKTMTHYIRSQETFGENPFRVPSLFLYSMADTIGQHGPIELFMEKMRANGIDVYSKCWPDSKHVSHFQRYPVEYISTLTDFLYKIEFLDEQMEEKLRMTG